MFKLRYLKWPAIALGSAGLISGGYGLLKDWRFDSDAPQADFPPPADLAEARHQDVAHLELFFFHERSWTEATRTAARQAYQDLSQNAINMSDAEFDLAVARVVAAANNAHTKVREYSRAMRFNRLPVRGHWFADGYYIIRTFSGYEDLLGQRVVAIDGVPFAEAANALRAYVAGPEGTFRKYAPYLLESPELMHAAGVTRSPERMSLTLSGDTTQPGSESETVIFKAPFPPPGDQIARSHFLLTRQAYAQSQPDWKAAAPVEESSPAYLDLPAERMQWRELPDDDAAYLQFWGNNNFGGTSIRKFCQASSKKYRQGAPRDLILDHRFNGGGNFGLTKDCMQDLARAVPDGHHIYIVMGGPTFSAGIYSVALAAQAAGDKAVLVGEPVGDSLQNWAEDNLLLLPNSQIEIKFSTGMHDLQNGCRDWHKCHWSVINLDLAIPDLDPDIYAPLNYEDFSAGIDPAMEAIREHQLARRSGKF